MNVDWMDLSDESKNRFSSHSCDEKAVHHMREIRQAVRMLARIIENTVPQGRDRSSALTYLQCTMMLANAGISGSHPIDSKELEP